MPGVEGKVPKCTTPRKQKLVYITVVCTIQCIGLYGSYICCHIHAADAILWVLVHVAATREHRDKLRKTLSQNVPTDITLHSHLVYANGIHLMAIHCAAGKRDVLMKKERKEEN